MGRYTRLLLIAGVITAAVYIFLSPKGELNRTRSAPEENVFLINDFSMSKAEGSGTYIINAASAQVYRDNNSLLLNDFDIDYSSEETDFYAEGEKGVYIENEGLESEGRITGHADGVSFETGDNGRFLYDFQEGEGLLENDVVYRQGQNVIRSDRSLMKTKEGITEFDGNVSVIYGVENSISGGSSDASRSGG
ncbi:hypothetical protein [Limisalsivibrio acetivorans]|uniref:hypothetical protein n=1 Tax=Limisalsivibrio acetivorans TaxID=1304888 RepID=UPI0003B36AED|nr:hypothetical protein [Limisalsivibrio acetivorans]